MLLLAVERAGVTRRASDAINWLTATPFDLSGGPATGPAVTRKGPTVLVPASIDGFATVLVIAM